MFFLHYVNELCIYLILCLSSSWFHLRLRSNLTDLYVLLIHCSPNMLMKLCIYLEICLSSRLMSIII